MVQVAEGSMVRFEPVGFPAGAGFLFHVELTSDVLAL